jgi:hypothetical protein
VPVSSPPLRAPGSSVSARTVSPAASTTSWFDHHPIAACTVRDVSIDTDRADLSRRDHLAATDFRLRSEVGALRVGVETDTARRSTA